MKNLNGDQRRRNTFMPTPFSGGCACGAIRYECTADPLFSANCHCRDCQRASGSAFASALIVPKTAFTLTKGAPKYHRVTADNGNAMERGFCPACGSPLFIDMAAYPTVICIQAASLDDPSWHRPTMDVWAGSAQPWDYMNPTLPKFKRSTTEEHLKELLPSRG
jgi:hypothetical protein